VRALEPRRTGCSYHQHIRYAGDNRRKLRITCQVDYASENMTGLPSKLVFDLTAGCLCLNFANTVDKRLSSQPEDKLAGYKEFVAFGQQTGVFSAGEGRKLRRGTSKSEAPRIFQQALELRELVYRIFMAVAARREVSDADAAALNAALLELNAGSRIAPVRGEIGWRRVEKSGAGRLIERILRSAVDILTTDDIARVKKCGAETCCWLFLDRSRSGNRRWCEMKTCGCRQKAKAYYRRKTAGRQREKAAPSS
jgi:predicted RNA-binding Zn ribbon-like protein